MAANDNETKLVLQISADVKSLERSLRQAGVISDKFNDQIQKDFTKSGQVIDQQSQVIDRSVRQTQQGVRNLSFQLTDITQGLLSGTSPFTIMVQQSGQVAQAFGELGKGGALSGFAQALKTMLSPQALGISALILGFGYLTKATTEYFTSSTKAADEGEEAWKQYAEAVKAMKGAYGEAMAGLEAYEQKTGEVAKFELARSKARLEELSKGLQQTTLRIGGDLIEFDPSAAKKLRQQLREQIQAASDAGNDAEVSRLRKEMEKFNDAGTAAAAGIIKVQDAFKGLEPEITAFAKSAADGTADFVALDQALALKGLSTTDEKLAKTIEKLREFIAEGVKMQKAVEAIEKSTADFAKAADVLSTAILPNLRKMFDEIIERGGGWDTLFGEKLPEAFNTWIGTIDTALTKLVELEKAAGKINSINFQPYGALSPVTSGGGVFNPSQTELDFQESLGNAAGAIDSFVERVIQAESGGRANAKNPNSSATGAGQFIDSTWLQTAKRYFAQQVQGLSDQQILAMRSDVEMNRRMIRAYAAENAQALVRGGQEVTEAALQLAHFLGSGGALKVLKAAPGTKISDIPGMEGAIAANQSILGGGATREDVLAYAERRTQAAKKEKLAYDELFAANQKRLEQQQYENQINGDTTKTIDEKTVAIERNKIAQQLLDAAKQQGLTIDDQLMASINGQADAMARAGVAAEQLSRTQKDAAEAAKQHQQAAEQLGQQYAQIAQSAISGFINDLRNGVEAGEAFRNMLNRVIDGLINMTIESLFAKNALGGIFGTLFGGGGGLLSKVGLYHRGTGGGTRDVRNVNPGIFAAAPRLHSGLNPGEFPAILQQGEKVIPRSTVRRGGSGGGGNTYLGDVAIDVQTGMVTASNEDARDLGQRINTAVQAVLVAESRPGGLLRQRGA